MAYTSNPHIGKTRRKAVRDVRNGSSVAAVARWYGVHRTTVHRWIKRAPVDHRVFIETLSSAPKTQARALPKEVVDRIYSDSFVYEVAVGK